MFQPQSGTGLRGETSDVKAESGKRPHGWKAGAPRICAVVSLSGDVDPWSAVAALEYDGEAIGVQPVAGKSVAEAKASQRPLCELESTRFRQTLQFLPLPYGALYATMDACRSADFVVLLLSADASIEPGSWGELCLRSLQAHGMPLVQAAVPTLGATQRGDGSSAAKKLTPKDAQSVRKSLTSFVQYFCPDVKKIHALDESSDRSMLFRALATSAPKRVAWRDFRSWCVTEGADYDAASRMLKVEGWIRGVPLSANRLVHIPDFGDFAVDRITYAPPPSKRGKRVEAEAQDTPMHEEGSAVTALEPGVVIDERDEEYADELVSENEPDTLANEQTWPTEEEMAGAPQNADGVDGGDGLPPALPGTTPKTITKKHATEEARKRYEAAWSIGSDDDDDDDAASDDMDDDEEDLADEDDDVAHASMDAADDESDDDAADAVEDDADSGFDDARERAAVDEFRQQQQRERDERKQEQSAADFPDEVDTPMEVPARQRFARYRGLESVYTSYWDPYEDLPHDYAKIFQFDDFSKTRKRVESSALFEGVTPGVRACIWLRDVPPEAAQRALLATGDAPHPMKKHEVVPFVLFGLLRHEHKKSVVNFTVTRNTEYDAPVRSKDPLVVCLGFRRYVSRPVYSQHVRNVGRRGNNVFKFERYLPHGAGAAVGSIYAPVTFGGASVPVVLYRERAESKEFGYDDAGVSAEQTPHLVGLGSLLDVSPKRIIAKRIVLSGHPYKLHKKTATIRFMFFNAGASAPVASTHPQTTCATLRRSRCAQSTDVLVTSKRASVHTATSKVRACHAARLTISALRRPAEPAWYV